MEPQLKTNKFFNKVDTLSFKTKSVSKETAAANKEWVVVDATDQIMGRFCSKVAKLARGKYMPNFTPHVDCGYNVIIINADKVKLTGKKWTDHISLTFTGYPGGQREWNPKKLQAKSSRCYFEKVLKGMLPKTKLGDKILGNIYVYDGAEHPHQAQNPKVIDINALN